MHHTTVRRVLGLDLGKRVDFSALALLEYDVAHPSQGYACRQLRRWPLGTGYLDVVADVTRFLGRDGMAGALLVLDASGVGESVGEVCWQEIREASVPCSLVMVTITGGLANTLVSTGRWHVSKRSLVSTLLALFGTKRLHISPELPEADVLVRELDNFTTRVTPAGNESYAADWRTGEHDDLVLALALAAWAAENIEWQDTEDEPTFDRFWT